MMKMQLVESNESKIVTLAIINMLEDWKPYILTMTADNGKEFTGHEKVARELNIDYYFAHPYHSWERGSNENLNGLIRQYIHKETDFSNLTIEFINGIEAKSPFAQDLGLKDSNGKLIFDNSVFLKAWNDVAGNNKFKLGC